MPKNKQTNKTFYEHCITFLVHIMFSINNFFLYKGFLNAILQVTDTQVEWTPIPPINLLN